MSAQVQELSDYEEHYVIQCSNNTVNVVPKRLLVNFVKGHIPLELISEDILRTIVAEWLMEYN